MRFTSFKNFLLFLLMLVLVTGYVGAFAQGLDHNSTQPARQELRAYYHQQVLPLVRQQRQKLENQLSAEDKAQLATYRAQLQATRQRRQALRQSLGPTNQPDGTGQAQRTELTAAQRQQTQQLRTDTRAIMLSVAQLAQKHEPTLAQLAAEIAPQREKWTSDIQAIQAKYAATGQLKKPGSRSGGRHLGGPDRFLRPTAFLLLNPNLPPVAPASGLSSTVFPNPSVGTNQLEYMVAKTGPVTVELLDGRGTTLRTLVTQQPQDKGAHALTINIADLPSGTYFYKITSRASTETKRFVKQ